MGFRRLSSLLVASVGVAVSASSCQSFDVEPPWGIDTRAPLTACQGFDTPLGTARTVRAYPNVTFHSPVQLVRHPTAAYWYVVNQYGTLQRFEDREDVTTVEDVADLTDRAAVLSEEDGLVGFTFEPSFATTGNAIIKYTALSTSGTSVDIVVARITSHDGGRTFDRATARELFRTSLERHMHHGGPPRFGKDGLLYVPLGDGGFDFLDRAQDLSLVEGKILRIDVTRDEAQPYTIPSDNPYVGKAGVRGEIWAHGLRNPWGWTFDPDGDGLWVGDVGMGDWEEVDHVLPGRNYGWPIREGARCKDDKPCDPKGLTDPVYEYRNFGGSAILAGWIYKGNVLPRARGHLVFADYIGGRVEHVDVRGAPVTSERLVDSGFILTGIVEDAAGEILLLERSGKIFRVTSSDYVKGVPPLLSQTGCVNFADPYQGAPGLVPYDVNMPLWSDAADKRRWMAVPDGKTLTVRDDGSLEAPIGTVLVKSFYWNARPIETRLLVRHLDGEWAGYSYEWNEDERDAQLVDIGRWRDLAPDFRWTYPSRSQCANCHTTVANRTLGLHLDQLNRTLTYPSGRTVNQLKTLDHLGLLTGLGDPESMTRLPRREEPNVSDDVWARAYLQTNCAHCHQPNGPGRGHLDMRRTASLKELGCGASSQVNDFGKPDALVVAPGDPDRSLLIHRVTMLGGGRMPPFFSRLVDDEAVARLRAWVSGLKSCD